MTLNIGENIGILKTRGVIKDQKSFLFPTGTGLVNSIFPVGETTDAGAGAVSTSLTIPTKTEAKAIYVGTMVSYGFLNHSGATDLFSYTVENTTRSITLATETNISVPNGSTVFDDIFAASNKGHKVGDTIRLRFTNGVLGTAAGQTLLGYVLLQAKNYEKAKNINIRDIKFEEV